MPITTIDISDGEAEKILSTEENHFSDLKSKEIAPSKLTKTIAALSNAEGGEVYVGVGQHKTSPPKNHWDGFHDPESANGHLQALETLFPLGDGYSYVFLRCKAMPGLVLKIDVSKSRDVKKASDDRVYVRRGAQNLPVDSEDGLNRLRRNKGLASFETEPVNVEPILITNSRTTLGFMLEVIPTSEPEIWLRKQQIIQNDKPTVAGLILFSDEPQAVLPKRSGIKIYRYQTSAEEGTRESLEANPLSVEGHAYEQIHKAVLITSKIIESVRIATPEGLEEANYPITALHEIITNAVLHRDYSIADDIHIRIFDNRVEVISPGTLPAHITPDNILEERFSRNAVIVRLINKFPDPPNKDVGEGLNTAFNAMRQMKLKPPIITQVGSSVKVVLRHESLASPEELILGYLGSNESITNRIARDLCFIGSENKMKVILQRLVKIGFLELVPGTTRYSAAYQLVRSKHPRRPHLGILDTH
jgi:ATP-dependent DNA helicase RecG